MGKQPVSEDIIGGNSCKTSSETTGVKFTEECLLFFRKNVRIWEEQFIIVINNGEKPSSIPIVNFRLIQN